MDRSAFVSVVFDQDGGSLVDKNIHTLYVAFKSSQVQRCVALRRPHIQIQQRLHEHLQGLVMPVICLKMNNTLRKCLKHRTLSLNIRHVFIQ